MRRVEFVVQGAPPKKDGANSMWNKTSERSRLIALRHAARECLGSSPPLQSQIQLDVEIHCPRNEIERVGDLDNFITGICDGLMAAARATPIAEDWSAPELEPIHPSLPIAFLDDRNILQINARKVPSDADERWYRVIVSGNE